MTLEQVFALILLAAAIVGVFKALRDVRAAFE